MKNSKTPIYLRAVLAYGGWALAPSLSLAQAADAQDAGKMEEVVVYGVVHGAEQAIKEQRESSTLVTIVSEETLETIPEQSVGEALSRLPGVSIQRDRGEAETITIRGADSRLNAVSVNGDRLLSPESTLDDIRGRRDVKLNSVPSTLISQIQVFKAVPPNMDGDSIGGAVEIKTKSAANLTDDFVEATGRFGRADLNEGDLYSGELTWGGRLNDAGTFGAIATVSYESSERGISGVQAEWGTINQVLNLATNTRVPLGGSFNVINTYDVIWRGFTRERKGANLTFDWQPGESNLIKLGGWWSEFEDVELRRRLQWRVGETADFTTATTFDAQGRQVTGATDGGRVRRRAREGTVERSSWNFFLEGDHRFGDDTWRFDWRVSHLFADQVVNRNYPRWEARAADLGFRGDRIADWTFTGGNGQFVQYTQPAWANNPAVLQIGNRGSFERWDNERSEDEMDSVKLDLGRKFQLGDGELNVQVGYKGQFRDRALWPRFFELTGTAANRYFMSSALGSDPMTPWQPFDYDNGLWGDVGIATAFFDANPGRLTVASNTLDQEYFVDETVHAAYLMGTFTRGRWTAVVGARFEDTKSDISARDGTAVNEYDNFLPAVIARYQLAQNQLVRAAWTNGIGRPDFFDLRPFFSDEFDFSVDPLTGVADASLRLDGGNPDLEPFEAQSFDLAYEYYTDSGGVLSAGVFYKEIENFEYNEELQEQNVDIGSLPPFLRQVAQDVIAEARLANPMIPANLTTLTRFNYARPVNGDVAELRGFELNVQQQFVGLPRPWNAFGVFLNYTGIDGESDVTGSISRDFVIGQFEYVANAQLFYEVPSFTARIAYNRNGVTYQNLGLTLVNGNLVDNPNGDLGVDVEYAWDFAVQYRRDMGDAGFLTVFVDVQNLTDEDSRIRFLGSESLYRFIELENGGRSYNLGIKWSR
jgi:TonB-dependent receptor